MLCALEDVYLFVVNEIVVATCAALIPTVMHSIEYRMANQVNTISTPYALTTTYAQHFSPSVLIHWVDRGSSVRGR